MICPPTHKHAETSTCYNRHRCRCTPCRRRKSTVARPYGYRDRALHGADVRVPALGTCRRLQALAVMGWSARQIAARSGLHEVFLARVRRGVKTTVATSTYRAVALVFEQLSMTRNSTRDGLVTSAWCAGKNWQGPLAWDDIDNPRERPKGATRGLVA